MVDFIRKYFPENPRSYSPLVEWDKIPNASGKYNGALILLLTKGRPYLHHAGKRFDFTNDIAVFSFPVRKINSYDGVIESDAALVIGGYEDLRRNVFGCLFREGCFLKGIDFILEKDMTLSEAKQRIPDYLGISLEDFLKLFELDGMGERCKSGLRELLV